MDEKTGPWYVDALVRVDDAEDENDAINQALKLDGHSIGEATLVVHESAELEEDEDNEDDEE